jgi:hypothetical protein
MLKRAAGKVARADTACWPSLCLHCSMLGRFILMNTEPCKSLSAGTLLLNTPLAEWDTPYALMKP